MKLPKYDGPVRWQSGHCIAHGKYNCASCKKREKQDERRDYDYGVFEWRSDGHYTRGTAIRIFTSEAAAQRMADKAYEASGHASGGLVVRTVRKEPS